ncbi:double-strand break repair helicase AddA [Rhodobacter ferrooxidans]|uniref:DNA 3'-5' helicase n=1 Tax=Rhodobacter ferrooxidans TaxID=371731 RepID=C8S137_9RHOB|nr:double-strand break repair helicase AddA [Rhodobacter sp. SW2]EEW25235.1 double-strand break repair helicase AddA [Rhodobacter sp. SW2]
MTRNDASARQVQAADPGRSTWLAANAGSGKTRVLTDRVARLLLEGVEPGRILCLTYTKAAASEMQNRLFRRLGGWAMLEDDALRAALADLGVAGAVQPETLGKARQLFARAIETPGGLRIQTIHSFCASLLRRFPLEAGVSPQFTELDDRAASLLRDEIVDELAEFGAPEAVADLARAYTGEDFSALAAEVAGQRRWFERPLNDADCRALFGLPKGLTAETLLAQVFLGGEAEWLAQVASVMATGSANDVKAADKLRALRLEVPDLAVLAALEDVLLTGPKAAEPFTAKLGSFPTKATQPKLGPLLPRLQDLMRRVEAAREDRMALLAADRTRILHAFAAAFLPRYAARKLARGALDFDDLIARAKALLTDPSVAQWVLFRLDGGIDHILVDEAQDTSPEQWDVIRLLAQEFTAGRGARDVPRTIFVVGDKKQSIYSFQGADVGAFEAMQSLFRANLAQVNTPLQGLELEYSFRSSPLILRLVDLTFDATTHADVGGKVNHIAFKSAMPGQVELWPALEPSGKPEDGDWFDPVDLISDEHVAARLGRQVAARIKNMIDAGVQIPVDGGERPVHAGDFLVLVRRRSAVFAEIIRACKAAGLPIAGADRLKLGGEMAVKDLASLLAFLATPEDDLALAEVLRSPLLGWTEGQLYTLAQGRTGYLWQALRQADAPETLAILHDLRDQADFLRPFDLIERALTRHDGRRLLLARLGPEAEDGIDELLSQALAYERNDVPSLTGFLSWLQTDDVEVKRQADSAGRRIRVMTVHGAKGLEAPIVILPDTADHAPRDRAELYRLADGSMIWKTAAEDSPAPTREAREARRLAAEAESLRLLYVAMTRAQCWLMVAAAGKVSGASWHDRIRAGMMAAGAEAAVGGGLILRGGVWPENAPRAGISAADLPALPDWAQRHAPVPPTAEKPLSPSDLGGAKVLPGDLAGDTAAAKLRGTRLHLLLEHLPGQDPALWPALAESLLAEAEDRLALLAEATTVLTAPDLAPIFAADALKEVSVTAEIDGKRLYGTIDRLILLPDRVLAIDYKSNSVIPATSAQVPEGLLRQMRAYAAALAQIYPDRRVETAILWTATARLMPVP